MLVSTHLLLELCTVNAQGRFTSTKTLFVLFPYCSFYMKASANAEITDAPTTNQPLCATFLFEIIDAVSQTKCLMPLKL